jgi:hypothetical protein
MRAGISSHPISSRKSGISEVVIIATLHYRNTSLSQHFTLRGCNRHRKAPVILSAAECFAKRIVLRSRRTPHRDPVPLLLRRVLTWLRQPPAPSKGLAVSSPLPPITRSFDCVETSLRELSTPLRMTGRSKHSQVQARQRSLTWVPLFAGRSSVDPPRPSRCLRPAPAHAQSRPHAPSLRSPHAHPEC